MSRLKKCLHCGEEVLFNAKKCKHCKSDLRSWINRHPIITLIIIIFVVGQVISWTTNSTSLNSINNVSNNSEPLLELVSFRTYRESKFAYIVGEVKNISKKPLENVQAVGVYFDKDKNLIKSESFLIEYTPILPNQISPFEILIHDNPAIEGGNVTFKHFNGGLIPTRHTNGEIIR